MRRSGRLGAAIVIVTALAACGSAGTHVSVRPGDAAAPDPTATSSTSTTSTSSATDSNTTTTTTSVAAAPAAADASRHVTGTHAGTEHFALGTGRCPVLDHRLDEVFTLDDGSAWQFASAYCGTVDADGVWSGTGIFTLNAADGSLSGRTTSRAQLPSPGVPYHLDIDAAPARTQVSRARAPSRNT